MGLERKLDKSGYPAFARSSDGLSLDEATARILSDPLIMVSLSGAPLSSPATDVEKYLAAILEELQWQREQRAPIKMSIIGAAQTVPYAAAILDNASSSAAEAFAAVSVNPPPMTREQVQEWIELFRGFQRMSEGPSAPVIEEQP